MKNIIKLSLYVFCLSLITIYYSCTDESKFTNPVTYNLENGAFAKFDVVPPTSFKPEQAQSLVFEADILDPNNNMIQYDLTVRATIVSEGRDFVAENFITLTSFPAKLSFTSADIASAIGVDLANFGAGDEFKFTAVATRNDGVKFYGITPSYDDDTQTIGLGNTDVTLLNAPAYKSAMRFSYIVACPMPSNYFVGKYKIEVVSSDAPFGPIFGSITEVEFVEKNVYQRTMDVTYLADLGIGNGDIPFEITFLCGQAYVTDQQASGLTCGGTIFLSNGGETPYNDGTFDDDGSLSITVLEDYAPGSPCGGDGNTILRFTKL